MNKVKYAKFTEFYPEDYVKLTWKDRLNCILAQQVIRMKQSLFHPLHTTLGDHISMLLVLCTAPLSIPVGLALAQRRHMHDCEHIMLHKLAGTLDWYYGGYELYNIDLDRFESKATRIQR